MRTIQVRESILNTSKILKELILGEEFLRDAFKIIAEEFREKSAQFQISKIPLSDSTVKRRIDEIHEEIQAEVCKRVQNSDQFALQLDESTDIASHAQLLVYARYIYEGHLEENILLCRPIPERTTGIFYKF